MPTAASRSSVRLVTCFACDNVIIMKNLNPLRIQAMYLAIICVALVGRAHSSAIRPGEDGRAARRTGCSTWRQRNTIRSKTESHRAIFNSRAGHRHEDDSQAASELAQNWPLWPGVGGAVSQSRPAAVCREHGEPDCGSRLHGSGRRAISRTGSRRCGRGDGFDNSAQVGARGRWLRLIL